MSGNPLCLICSGKGWVLAKPTHPAYSEHGDLEREPCPNCIPGENEFGKPDLSGVEWDNDVFFFTYEYTDESSQFDPKARWNPGGEYYERVYKCRVPLAFRMCEELTERFVQMMDEWYPGAEGFYVD